MFKRFFVVSLFFLFAFQARVSSEEVPFLVSAAKNVEKPPVVDGKLDDACWKGVEEITGFTCVLTKSGLASAQTYARVVHDTKSLFIALRCDEPKMAEIENLIPSGHFDGWSECVEMFISDHEDRAYYYQFRVNILGDSEEALGYDATWEAPWLWGVERQSNNWTVEMAVPFTAVGLSSGPATIVGFNLNRSRTITAPYEHSCWSNTGGGFHAPRRFGNLIFEDYGKWLCAYIEREAEGFSLTLTKLLQEYPKATAEFADVFAAAEDERRSVIAEVSLAKITSGEEFAAFYGRAQSLLEKYESFLHDVRLAIIRQEFKSPYCSVENL